MASRKKAPQTVEEKAAAAAKAAAAKVLKEEEKKAAAAAKKAEAAAKAKEVARKKAEAEREAAKKKTEASKKAKHTATLRELAPLAKEINVRLEKAAKAEGVIADHRLAAALQLTKAKGQCEAAGIKFKQWAEENVVGEGKSYETVRKLTAVGSADDPAQALEDLRAKNAFANKQHRQKQIAKKAATAKAGGKSTPKEDPFQRVVSGLNAMPDDQRVKAIKDRAEAEGFAVVSVEDAKQVKKITQDAKSFTPLERAKNAFDDLSNKDKMTLVEYVCEKTGVEVTNNYVAEPEAPAEVNEDLIPASTDRRPAAKRKRRTPKAA